MPNGNEFREGSGLRGITIPCWAEYILLPSLLAIATKGNEKLCTKDG